MSNILDLMSRMFYIYGSQICFTHWNGENMNNLNMGSALAIGIGIGAALGVAMDNLALGIGIGVAIGTAFGAFASSKNSDKQ